MRKLDECEWVVLGSSALCLIGAITALVLANLKENQLKESQFKACECRCFDAGYSQAMADVEEVLNK